MTQGHETSTRIEGGSAELREGAPIPAMMKPSTATPALPRGTATWVTG